MEFEPSNSEFSIVWLSLVLCMRQFCLSRRSWHNWSLFLWKLSFQKGTYLPQTYIIQEEMIATEHVSDMEQLGSFIYRLCSGKETYRLKRRSARRRKSLAVFSSNSLSPRIAVIISAVTATLASSWQEGRFPCGCKHTGDLLRCFPSNSSKSKSVILLLQMSACCCVLLLPLSA